MPRSRDDDDFDDRPRRPRGPDRGDDDRPRRRDDDEYDRSPRARPRTMSTLGLLSLIGGILSLLFSFIPCIGALGIIGGVVGLLLGAIGLRIASTSNQGKGLPVAGLIVNLLSILVAGAWILFIASSSGKSTLNEVETADAIVISAGQLSRDYDTNVVKADETYKGKVLEVTGQVKLVSKERIGRITVELGSGDDTIDCDFGSATKSDLAGIDVGQTVTIRGKCKGVDRKSKYVVLESCKRVSAAAAEGSAPAGKAIPVEAAKLLEEYAADDGVANKAYKGKVVEVTMVVSEVEDENKREIILVFRPKKGPHLECRLTPEASKKAGDVREGQKVTVRGTCAGLRDNNEYLLVENAAVVK